MRWALGVSVCIRRLIDLSSPAAECARLFSDARQGALGGVRGVQPGRVPKKIGIAEARLLLRPREELLREGYRERELRTLQASGSLVRVRRGWYAPGDRWRELWPEGQHLLLVLATADEMVGGTAVASYASAAVLHEIAMYRPRFSRVHVTVPPGPRASSSAAVMRHAEDLSEDDIVEIRGVRCTSLERTAYDLMRLATIESAVTVADAVLGRAAVSSRLQDPALAALWRARMHDRLSAAGPTRGSRQARWVTEFADGRAELPLESVSRLQLHRLGFARPQVQVPIAGPNGRDFWVDLGLDDADAWAEIDGQGKYRDIALRSGRDLETVLLEEKRREDWIRGRTGRRFVRWGDAEAASAESLRVHLATFGIRSPR